MEHMEEGMMENQPTHAHLEKRPLSGSGSGDGIYQDINSSSDGSKQMP